MHHAGFVSATVLSLALAPLAAAAAEGYRLRAAPVGVIGIELATPIPQGGFFFTALPAYTEVRRAVGGSGETLTVPARGIPLPTSAPTGGAIPDGTYSLRIPAAEVALTQAQAQVNVAAGYATSPVWAGGTLVFRLTLPLINQHRSFRLQGGAPQVMPTPSSPPLPPAAVGAVNAIATAAAAQAQASLAATSASQNRDVTGVGDAELAAAWLRDAGPLRIVAGGSLHLPTGTYDPARGPNPGFGDFRTWQAGAAALYTLPGGTAFGGRIAWGTNSTNRKTGIRTGDFVALEATASHAWGSTVGGLDYLALRQVTDDGGAAGVLPAGRYRSDSLGVFATRSLGDSVAATLLVARTFHERNAFAVRTAQLRLAMGW